MALIYPMPMNVPDTVSNSYQRQNTLMYAVMADHLSLSLTNLDNSSVPKVQAGSVFGVNGGLFYVPDGADEAISGSPATGQNYVYAVPNDDGATFQYSATKPVWSATKGGWYNGNNRAVAKVYYVSSQYNNKVVLDRQAAMYETNKTQPLPTSGGTQIATGTVNQVKTLTLEPGFYRFEMMAGKGGNGGKGGDLFILDYLYPGFAGGIGVAGESLNKSFILTSSKTISYGLGGDGNNGNNGVNNDSARGNAGAGCSGGMAFIDDDEVMGGSAGGGGMYGLSSGVMANGGGGFGTASSSITTGLGGSNGRGGPDIINPGLISKSLFIYCYARGGDANEGGTIKGGDSLKSTSSGYLRIYRCG
jgi:hypothetical protein